LPLNDRVARACGISKGLILLALSAFFTLTFSTIGWDWIVQTDVSLLSRVRSFLFVQGEAKLE